jgi:hypothetical protein
LERKNADIIVVNGNSSRKEMFFIDGMSTSKTNFDPLNNIFINKN